ncbi:MAG TPA: thiamine-binding protein [Anaerolineae bacterium]|nr:thiamine-binding protein [Anaerolineae bacterium]
MTDITVSFEVIPICDDPYPIVDKAIEVVQRSGVKYEVGPHETTMEGELDQLVDIVKAGHRACLEAGAPRVITFVKIVDAVGGTTIAEKVAKYRES